MRVLITGGAGFIGYHLAADRIRRWDKVTVVDNLSRRGSGHRAALLAQRFPDMQILDRDLASFSFEQRYDCVFHLAGQTAVTRSVDRPFDDFYHNLQTTVMLLDRIWNAGPPYPKVIYASTNKVYGSMLHVDPVHPINENCPLDLKTPYGVSKGAADCYMQEYGRLYGIPTLVLRQSCIYGPEQTAEADQGWLTYFAKCITHGIPFTIYGDGRQVRDILHVDDLVELFDSLLRGSAAPGEVFNVGGGPVNTVTLLGAIGLIEKFAGRSARYEYALRRPGDQQCYISDISKVYDRLKWEPRIQAEDGIRRLAEWWSDRPL